MAILINVEDRITAHCDTTEEAAALLGALVGAPVTASVRREPEAAPKALPDPAKPRALPAPKATSRPGPKPGSPGSVSARILAELSKGGHWTVEDVARRVGHEPKQTRDLLGYLKRIDKVVRFSNGKWAAKGA